MTEKIKNKGGRPKKLIDFKVFEELCKIQCTQVEIANVLDIDVDTLQARLKENYGVGFSEIHKKFADHGRMSLRRYQFRMAEHNPTMAIWLGKQYLGQVDNSVQVNNEFINQQIEIVTEEKDLSRFSQFIQ